MGIITKEVEVKLWGNNIKHYHNLGYSGKHGDIITVKVEDLSEGSNVKIQYLCDYCQKEVVTIVYADYIRRTKEVDKMACKNCYTQKIKEVSLLRYGVSSYTKTKECQRRKIDTVKSRYGVEHYSQTQDFKEKWNNTCTERYGESYRKQFMDKAFETFHNKTGYRFPLQSPDVKEKAVQTFYQNGTTISSKQQIYIFNLYHRHKKSDVELNYPVACFNSDICFPEEKIVVEYDGKGHDLIVTFGNLTQEEFNRRELIRDRVIKSEGYKIIRIISSTDKLPSDLVLLQMLSDARCYFSQYLNHSWIEFNISTSTIRNAENPQGLPYSFGELRTIKDNDITMNNVVIV